MRKNLKSLIVSSFLFLNLTINSIQGRVLQKSIIVRAVEERVDDTIFIHRVDIIDGIKKELWAINGKEVSADEYEKSILIAELHERKNERRKQEKLQADREAFIFEAQRTGMINLLKCYIDQISQIIHKYDDNRLTPFLVFNEQTIGSQEEFDRLQTEFLSRAHQMISQNNNEFSLQELKQMIMMLEPYPDRLQNFYFATITYAQTHADDTKLLKDLLERVSEIV